MSLKEIFTILVFSRMITLLRVESAFESCNAARKSRSVSRIRIACFMLSLCVIQVCLAPPGGQDVRPSGQNHRRPRPELWAGARSPGQERAWTPGQAGGGGLDPEIVSRPDQHCRLGLPGRQISSFSVSCHAQLLADGIIKLFY